MNLFDYPNLWASINKKINFEDGGLVISKAYLGLCFGSEFVNRKWAICRPSDVNFLNGVKTEKKMSLVVAESNLFSEALQVIDQFEGKNLIAPVNFSKNESDLNVLVENIMVLHDLGFYRVTLFNAFETIHSTVGSKSAFIDLKLEKRFDIQADLSIPSVMYGTRL